MPTRKKFHKEVRVEEALKRQDYYSKLTPKQKLEKLDDTLGKGVGAKRQRAKLAKELSRDS